MDATGRTARLTPVTDHETDRRERGRQIQELRLSLGLSKSETVAKMRARYGKFDPGTLTRAEDGDPGMREDTLRSIEKVLEGLDREMSSEYDEARRHATEATASGLITVRLTGNFGVSATVSAPVENQAELQEMVDAIMAKMSSPNG